MHAGVSKLRGFWTDNPDFLIEHSATLDVTALVTGGPIRAVAGLGPAAGPDGRGNPASSRGAEGRSQCPGPLERTSRRARPGAVPATARTTSPARRRSGWSASWPQLGRETGQARHWTSALALLDGIISRISHLGLSLRSFARGIESGRQTTEPGGAASNLHAKLIDTMLDLAGLDYDAVDARLIAASGPDRAMDPDRDQAVAPVRRRVVSPRAADRHQALSPSSQDQSETSRRRSTST